MVIATSNKPEYQYTITINIAGLIKIKGNSADKMIDVLSII
jgi:hypothetical protein